MESDGRSLPNDTQNDEKCVEEFGTQTQITGKWETNIHTPLSPHHIYHSLLVYDPVEDSREDEAQHGTAARAYQSHQRGEVGNTQYDQTGHQHQQAPQNILRHTHTHT